MLTPTVQLPRPHSDQRQLLAQSRRFNVADCGRRYGKSTLAIDRLVGPALAGFPVAYFSPSYRMLTDVWRDLKRILQPVTSRSNAVERRIELVTGGLVDMWSLENPDSSRGRKYKRIVVDEAAMIRELEEAWQAVIRPTLTDFAGDAWFLSTPKGRNYFWQLYQRGQDPAYPDWVSWTRPTSANPFIAPAEIAAARADLPELTFSQEYLAQFIEDGGGVFRRIRDAATAQPQDKAVAGHSYLVSVDWGKSADFTVIAVWDASISALVHLDRFNQIDYALQSQRLHAVCDRFKPLALVPELNSMGIPLAEQLGREAWTPDILPFTTNNASKALAVEAFALALERGAVQILDDPILIGELQGFEMERLPSGLLRYGAPAGQHDDCVMAVIIGYSALVTDGPQVATYDDPISISPF